MAEENKGAATPPNGPAEGKDAQPQPGTGPGDAATPADDEGAAPAEADGAAKPPADVGATPSAEAPGAPATSPAAEGEGVTPPAADDAAAGDGEGKPAKPSPLFLYLVVVPVGLLLLYGLVAA
ncbi:MAG: hypothetical protein ACYS9X_32480, partial [Planctomycetota bacterium]